MLQGGKKLGGGKKKSNKSFRERSTFEQPTQAGENFSVDI